MLEKSFKQERFGLIVIKEKLKNIRVRNTFKNEYFLLKKMIILMLPQWIKKLH
jgi:hypothetical protein